MAQKIIERDRGAKDGRFKPTGYAQKHPNIAIKDRMRVPAKPKSK